MTRVGTADAFIAWLNSRPRAGARVEYHHGFLANDREQSAEVNRLAQAVMRAVDWGRVSPIQRRIGDGAWLYVAEATGK
jgi:hypothetical protein